MYDQESAANARSKYQEGFFYMKSVFFNKFLSLIFASFLFITAIFPAYADELEEKQKELEAINQQMEEQQYYLDQTQKEANNILWQIQGLDKNISATQKDLNVTNARLNQLNNTIKQTEKEIQQKDAEINQKTDQLGERLVYIYEEGTVSFMEVLLSSTSLKDFLTRYDMLKTIVDEDIRLIESINSERRDLDLRKSNLQISKKEVENNQLIIQAKQDELTQQKGTKKDLLASVEKEKEKLQQALDELEQSSKQLESYIRSRTKGGGSAVGTGSMTWPAPGYTNITSPYGMRYHPILKVRKMHTGVDIGAPGGATIVAADSGTVILAGWQTGYGQTTIIDHGNGISTLYAHQQAFYVSEGDVVKKGQAIGEADSTGWSTGNHLHFEVRVNGNPVDPMPYI